MEGGGGGSGAPGPPRLTTAITIVLREGHHLRDASRSSGRDPATGEILLSHREFELAREEEADARRAAEAHTAVLEARVLALERAPAVRTRQHPEQIRRRGQLTASSWPAYAGRTLIMVTS